MEELGIYMDEEYNLTTENGDFLLPAYSPWGGKNIYLSAFPELNGTGGRKVLPIAVITPGGVVLKKP